MTQPIPRARLAAAIAVVLASPAALAASFTATASMTWNELTISTTGIGGGPAPTLTLNDSSSYVYGYTQATSPSAVDSSGGSPVVVGSAQFNQLPGGVFSSTLSASANTATAGASLSWNGSGPGPSIATATATDLTVAPCPSCAVPYNAAQSYLYNSYLFFSTSGAGFVTISVPYSLTVNQAGTNGASGLVFGYGSSSAQLSANVSYASGSGSGSRYFDEYRQLSFGDGVSADSGVMRLGFYVEGAMNGYVTPYMSAVAQLSAVTPVPEPAEWAMMLAGLGLVGGLARRRGAAVPAIAAR